MIFSCPGSQSRAEQTGAERSGAAPRGKSESFVLARLWGKAAQLIWLKQPPKRAASWRPGDVSKSQSKSERTDPRSVASANPSVASVARYGLTFR